MNRIQLCNTGNRNGYLFSVCISLNVPTNFNLGMNRVPNYLKILCLFGLLLWSWGRVWEDWFSLVQISSHLEAVVIYKHRGPGSIWSSHFQAGSSSRCKLSASDYEDYTSYVGWNYRLKEFGWILPKIEVFYIILMSSWKYDTVWSRK